MTSLENSFKRAVSRSIDERGKPATLGKTDGTLYWIDPSGMTHRTRVWARIGEQNSNQEVVVDCLNASPQIDLPVRVDYKNGVLTVIDVDGRRAVEFGGGRGGGSVAAHAWLHSRLGPDPLYIEGLQYLPLLVTPTNPPDLTVTVQAGAYYDLAGDMRWLDTAVSGSTSAYVPGSGYHFVIICLDRSDGSIVIVDGDDVSGGGDALFPDPSAITAAEIEAITIDPDYYPLAVVLLAAGQTQIKAKEIAMPLRPVGAIGGGASDVDDLTTATGSSGEMVRVAAAGGLEYRTTAEVLSDIGAAASGHSHSAAGSDGQLQYNNGGAFGGSGTYWDDVNSRLGVGTGTPAWDIQLLKSQNGTTAMGIRNDDTGTSAIAQYRLEMGAFGFAIGGALSTHTAVLPGYAAYGFIDSNFTNGFALSAISGTIDFRTGGRALANRRVIIGSGVVVGSPTGGDKGVGTINAVAIYDDNVLLTDFIFEDDYHLLPINEMKQFFTENKHLPTIPGRKVWESEGKFSLGKLVNHLWETVEVQAIYISQLNERLEVLENGK